MDVDETPVVFEGNDEVRDRSECELSLLTEVAMLLAVLEEEYGIEEFDWVLEDLSVSVTIWEEVVDGSVVMAIEVVAPCRVEIVGKDTTSVPLAIVSVLNPGFIDNEAVWSLVDVGILLPAAKKC